MLPPTATLRVLLVEDDADTRANIRDILELDGYSVSLAGTLAEAQAATDSSFDVVILDRRLPDGNIDEILPELVQRWSRSDIIVVTGFAELDSTIAAFRYGIADYILKPINPDALRQSLRRIDDRHQIENVLQREQQFANQMLRTAEAIVLVLDLNGNVIQFNPFLERLTGWKLSEVLDKDWFEYFVPQDERQRVRDTFMETLTDIKTTSMVNPVLCRDGNIRRVRWSNSCLKNQAGKTTSVLAVGIDITEMLAAQTRSLQSERLAAIGKTMAALAHESRNALQRIHAGLEMLELEIPDQADAQKDLRSVRRATSDLQSVLEEVRSFAAPVLLHIENTDLRLVWQRVWRQLNPATEKTFATLVEPSPSDNANSDNANSDNANIAVDIMRMEQVFRNLFENAIAAMKTIGSESNTDAKPQIRVTCTRDDSGDLSVEIADSGPGFETGDHQQLFEPFYTTKPTGTGLGLAIVARIIEAHRGSVAVKPSDSGACFVMTLPTDLSPSSAPRHFREPKGQ
ncbi:Sensor histidine kinase TmoS [Rubripirellula obstinata]|uniref:histidine kinase n=2 Tax=Rubripirellula obstinata TaxID=406547 RepID=A0A5B1CH69_9BACT|nr:ATP-binding protein [Rubripirellula obstinata]KAA1259275.1 Sensor histidine kinase TmoS [Rubripirellula obstinata]